MQTQDEDNECVCPQSASVMQTAAHLLTAPPPVSVPVRVEPQGDAATPVYLDTPGEELEPAAQVQKAGILP